MSETDVLNPLDQAIEEFHKLRDDSRRLFEQAQWPEVKTPSQASQEALSSDPVAALEVPVR